MNWLKWAIPVLGGMATGAKIDITAYINARKEDPQARFDWALFAARLADGAIGGLIVAAGLSAVPDA